MTQVSCFDGFNDLKNVLTIKINIFKHFLKRNPFSTQKRHEYERVHVAMLYEIILTNIFRLYKIIYVFKELLILSKVKYIN